MIIPLKDLPELPSKEFKIGNSIGMRLIANVLRLDLQASGYNIKVSDGFRPTGICWKLPRHLGRKNCVGIMLFSPDEGEVWQQTEPTPK